MDQFYHTRASVKIQVKAIMVKKITGALLVNIQVVTSALLKPVPGVFANNCLHLQFIGFCNFF